jgi:hypothetical protein
MNGCRLGGIIFLRLAMKLKGVIMRNSRRNIPDPISPENPVIKKDVIETNRVQDHLAEKVAPEEIFDPNVETKNKRNESPAFNGSNDDNLEDES